LACWNNFEVDVEIEDRVQLAENVSDAAGDTVTLTFISVGCAISCSSQGASTAAVRALTAPIATYNASAMTGTSGKARLRKFFMIISLPENGTVPVWKVPVNSQENN
jgi:hypothetical protein